MLDATSVGAGVVATRVGACLVLTLGEDLAEPALERARSLVVEELRGPRVDAVVFDLSALLYLDSREFTELRSLARMTGMLGARTIFVGFRPGIIVHLMRLDVDITGMHVALGLNEALQALGIVAGEPDARHAP